VEILVPDNPTRDHRHAGDRARRDSKIVELQSGVGQMSVHRPGEQVMAEYVQVLTTVDSEEAGLQLGRSIVSARLAACVQIVGPIRSLYWWQGKVDDAREWQLLMKTTTERLPALEAHIKANHSYDTPEIIVTPIAGGSAEYLNWVSEETGQAGVS
jgi:periplasmic divalent cation tolerance protein